VPFRDCHKISQVRLNLLKHIHNIKAHDIIASICFHDRDVTLRTVASGTNARSCFKEDLRPIRTPGRILIPARICRKSCSAGFCDQRVQFRLHYRMFHIGDCIVTRAIIITPDAITSSKTIVRIFLVLVFVCQAPCVSAQRSNDCATKRKRNLYSKLDRFRFPYVRPKS